MADEANKPTLEQLVALYGDALYRFAYRLSGSASDAEDVVQETFLTACRKIGSLRDPKLALAWLYQILRRIWIRQLSKAPTVNLDEFDVSQIANAPMQPEPEFTSEEIQSALNATPPEYREPLVLFYFEELKYREIAELMDLPIGTVMSRIARAKGFVRDRLLRTSSGSGKPGGKRPKEETAPTAP